ncbi:MAG TPA: hypothetical protein PKA94_11470, partial [Ferruginibacter sp.]|nr:hypothetical protein [Ferruginibacter sp.]
YSYFRGKDWFCDTKMLLVPHLYNRSFCETAVDVFRGRYFMPDRFHRPVHFADGDHCFRPPAHRTLGLVFFIHIN